VHLAEVLRATLADGRMSRSERQALEQVLADVAGDVHALRAVRGLAFDLARDELGAGSAAQVLEWLEDVVRVLNQQRDRQRPVGVAEALFTPGLACVRRLTRLIERSRTCLDVCVFTITDDRISGALMEAHDRGVRVRVISDDAKALDPGSDIARIGDGGVAVRVDHSEAHMHHKFAIFDRSLLATGSFNWTRSASEGNHENLVVVDHPRLLQRFIAEFERLWQALGTT
jgi:phosphatidylserine/phosphatidylglycerophosphate/cardiolipin synthase-like enzyme